MQEENGLIGAESLARHADFAQAISIRLNGGFWVVIVVRNQLGVVAVTSEVTDTAPPWLYW